ncbi:MAG TPA: xanthine dehydrogenase family protein molybdopterin-binding subunit [Pseudomonadales bacterium]|nr:xanthine dehydrogenase family protein molybdopterin-binding subunit [Pseudomonadales bacterium]
MKSATIGPARNRVDGRLKVTGAAKYAVEFDVPNCAYAWPVDSTIAKGTISAIDTEAARAVPGVLAVLTHQNAPKLSNPPKDKGQTGIRNEERLPLSDATVYYAGQYVALVVAQSAEQARYAASLVRVTYARQRASLTMDEARASAERPEENNGDEVQIAKGDVDATLRDPQLVKIEQTYVTPAETHNPIEMSGTIAAWSGDTLTIYDATQFVKGVQHIVAASFGIDADNVHVICPFVGGAFGCKGAVWPHVLLAAMAAKSAGVPVKLHISRQDMFTGTGHRTPTRQRVALAATHDGKLRAMRHVTETCTSTVGQYVESCGARSTAMLYDSPVIRVEETVYPVNVATPTFMRAPGECPGTYALECAMDELAYALKIDPVQLRVLNYADNHPTKNVPFSAKYLKDCYALGADRFGWAKRNPNPGSMRDGDLLVGWGMATATYPAYKMKAAVKVQLRADNTVTVQCATHDLGTGAYTAFTQISSEELGVPFENVTFELGRSDFPFGPVAGGSNSTATVGTAIHEAARQLHTALAELATNDSRSPLHGVSVQQIRMVAEGRIGTMPEKSEAYTEILQRAGRTSIDVETQAEEPAEDETHAFQSFGAHFVEVKIDPLLPRVSVSRVVSVMNNGRVVTAKPARSQIIGGVTMGIGMALTEETVYDPATGLPVTRNLADYHVPTNADVPDIDVQFVGEPDYTFNPIGARGMGEIGITGVAAAIANAVFHATGKRVRDLPITPDKLLTAV